jgi:regulator of protease activity HflC (stomatin/prohibitin superfamily)
MAAYPWSLDGKPPPPPAPRSWWWQVFETHLPNVSIVLMVITLLAAVLYPHMVVTVPSGHVGVLWKRLRGGTVLDEKRLRNEGLHIILPWDQLFQYDLRLQTSTDSYTAISRDGVSITATINARFRLRRDSIPRLHQSVGPDYKRLLVVPEVGNRMREVIAQYTAEEVYSTKRQDVQNQIRGRTVAMLDATAEMRRDETEYGAPYKFKPVDAIDLSETLVLHIELPAAVVGAINRKVEQYYAVEEYAFRVEREKKESERKQIEANGIHAFQQTVSQGISDSYLRWRGIEATLQLAQSSNAKIVIVGSGKDGLPIILGNVDAPASSSAAATTPAERDATKEKDKDKDKENAPATPSEKTGAAGSSTPPEKSSSSDKPPTAGSTPTEKTPAAGSKSGSARKTEEPSASTSLRWSDIESFLSRLSEGLRSSMSETPKAEKPATEQPR